MQVSDDEDETHPNIDTRSLFKWRHEARVQRMEDMDKKKTDIEKKIDEYVFLTFSESYSEPSETSKRKRFAKTVNIL